MRRGLFESSDSKKEITAGTQKVGRQGKEEDADGAVGLNSRVVAKMRKPAGSKR
jgi:hypothetical protein